MKDVERLLALLQSKGVWYQHDSHPLAFTAREAAAADRWPQAAFAKCVVVHSTPGYAIAVVPADRQVDLNEIRECLGWPHVRLASEKELLELFPGSELGAMPPFGHGLLYDLPVYADGLLMAEDTLAFNAGTHRDAVHLKTDDWSELVRPQVMSFAHSRKAFSAG